MLRLGFRVASVFEQRNQLKGVTETIQKISEKHHLTLHSKINSIVYTRLIQQTHWHRNCFITQSWWRLLRDLPKIPKDPKEGRPGLSFARQGTTRASIPQTKDSVWKKFFCACNLQYFSLKFIEASFVPCHSIQEQPLARCIMGNMYHKWGTGVGWGMAS